MRALHMRTRFRLQRYKEFLGCANNGTKFLKIKQNYSFIAECTVSSGADRSERSEDKKVTKIFSYNKIKEQNSQNFPKLLVI